MKPKHKNKNDEKDSTQENPAETETTGPKTQPDELEKEKQQLFEQLQRVSADYANYQKRVSRQIADSVEYEKKTLIKSLLPSLDNFEHALSGVRDSQDLESVVRGVQLILEHMLDTLKTHGVEQIRAKGCQFDPAKHEAIQVLSEENQPDNAVLEELQKGYLLSGQLLRPARVVVNKLPRKPSDSEQKSQADEFDNGDDTDSQQPSDEE